MPARTRRSGITKYGWQHTKRAKQDKAALTDGTPCPFCHKPMTHTQKLDWDHTHQAITHAYCNRRDGAIRGNRARGARQRRLPAW